MTLATAFSRQRDEPPPTEAKQKPLHFEGCLTACLGANMLLVVLPLLTPNIMFGEHDFFR